MKNVVTGIMMSIILALITIIILTTDDRIIRINEVNTALADALDESINVLDMDKYSIFFKESYLLLVDYQYYTL